MDKPPPRDGKRKPDDLAEVERALSVLKGRHPEHERIAREDAEKQAARKAKLDSASRAETDAAKRRRSKLAVAIGAAVVVLGVAAFFFRSEVSRRGELEQLTNPYRAMGFVIVETSARGAPGALEENIEPGCLVAASTGAAPLTITIGSTKIEGPGPALFCTCQNEKVSITSPIASGGLALLRADAARIGGSRAFAFAPVEPKTTAKTDDACADASFDAWLEAGHWPKPTVDDAAVPAPLRAMSFASLATMKSSAPFAVLEVPAESCLVARSSSAEDLVALRFKGTPARVVEAKGSVAWCAKSAGLAIVEREGGGDVQVTAAPAARLGGTLGMREIAREAKVEIAKIATPAADRGWDARASLVASAVPEGLVNAGAAPSIPVDVESRIFAVSFGTPSALTPDTPADTYSFCDPPLDANATEAICSFSGPVTWRVAGSEAVGGVGRSKVPFWLFALQGQDDPAALKVTTQLLGIGRALKRVGFEPTTLEAVTEIAQGVEVLGRTGEDAVVAIMIANAAPYAFPLTASQPWTLDGKPEIAPLAPLQKVVLTSSEKKLPPLPTRRTVVFRRKGKS